MTWQCWAQVWASLSRPPPPPHHHPSPGKTLKTWSGSSVMATMITMMVMMMMTDHFPPFLSSFSSCFSFSSSSSFCRETSKYNIFVVQIFTSALGEKRRKSHKFCSPAECSKVYIWETLIFSWPSTHLTWNIKFKIWNLIWRNTEFFLAILPLISYLWEKRRGINIEISLSSYYWSSWSSFFYLFIDHHHYFHSSFNTICAHCNIVQLSPFLENCSWGKNRKYFITFTFISSWPSPCVLILFFLK